MEPIQDREKLGLYKKRKDEKIFALLLPVPSYRKAYATKGMGGDSKLAVELYFSDDILLTLGNLAEETVSGVKEKRKIFQGDKANFWKKLFSLKKEDFVAFKSLFEQVGDLFKI